MDTVLVDTNALLFALLTPERLYPFDRVLVAQAIVEGLPILSADPQLDRYPARRVR